MVKETTTLSNNERTSPTPPSNVWGFQLKTIGKWKQHGGGELVGIMPGLGSLTMSPPPPSTMENTQEQLKCSPTILELWVPTSNYHTHHCHQTMSLSPYTSTTQNGKNEQRNPSTSQHNNNNTNSPGLLPTPLRLWGMVGMVWVCSGDEIVSACIE